MDEAEQLCARGAIMDHGVVIARGTPRELIASIGIEHVIEFSTGPAPHPLDIEAVQRLPGVRESGRQHDGSVRLQASELHHAVPALLAELARQAQPLTELRTRSA